MRKRKLLPVLSVPLERTLERKLALERTLERVENPPKRNMS
jgi:hypothetical protein